MTAVKGSTRNYENHQAFNEEGSNLIIRNFKGSNLLSGRPAWDDKDSNRLFLSKLMIVNNKSCSK